MLPVATVTFAGADQTCLVEAATIRHGRDDPSSQPEADAATFDILGALPAGVDIGTPVTLNAQLGGVTYPRFAGLVTDLHIGWDTPDTPVCQVIAVGQLARMGNRIVNVALPRETDGARAARAITAAGVPTDGARNDPGTLEVMPRPKDPAPALQIAQEAAEDGAGMLWQAKDGAVLYADSDHRRGATIELALDPCAMPLDVTWVKNLEGLVNDLTINWGNTGVDGDGDGEGAQSRQTLSYTTANLAPYTSEVATITLAPSYRLMHFETDQPAWFRCYDTMEHLTADTARPFGLDPPASIDHGLMLEFVTGPELYGATLSPTVDGFDNKESPDGKIPFAVTNLDSLYHVITFTLVWIATEQ